MYANYVFFTSLSDYLTTNRKLHKEGAERGGLAIKKMHMETAVLIGQSASLETIMQPLGAH